MKENWMEPDQSKPTLAALFLAGSILALSAADIRAAITFPSGGGTYSYNAYTADAPDPNGVTNGFATFVTKEVGIAAYYDTLGNGATGIGTLSYTFDAAPGQVFTNVEVTDRFTIFYGDSSSSITAALTTDNNPTPFVVKQLFGNGGVADAYTTYSLPVSQATSFTLTYALTNNTAANIFVQLFMDYPADTTPNTPFIVVAQTAVPEPSAVALLGMSGVWWWIRRRRS